MVSVHRKPASSAVLGFDLKFLFPGSSCHPAVRLSHVVAGSTISSRSAPNPAAEILLPSGPYSLPAIMTRLSFPNHFAGFLLVSELRSGFHSHFPTLPRYGCQQRLLSHVCFLPLLSFFPSLFFFFFFFFALSYSSSSATFELRGTSLIFLQTLQGRKQFICIGPFITSESVPLSRCLDFRWPRCLLLPTKHLNIHRVFCCQKRSLL